jgi:hypothetical protein
MAQDSAEKCEVTILSVSRHASPSAALISKTPIKSKLQRFLKWFMPDLLVEGKNSNWNRPK